MFRVALPWFAVVLCVLCPWRSMDCRGQTREAFEQARQHMVEEYLVAAGIKNEKVLQSARTTLRHEFVAPAQRSRAYFDMALPIGEHQTISSPFIVAYMTQSLDPQPTDKVLEIGTGSGYQAAILSPLVKEVYSIEIVESLGKKAKKLLEHLEYKNIFTKIGDGYQGWVEHAPFDKIIVTCSPEKVPQPLVDQLAENGIMAIPVGERYQQTLYIFRKVDGKLKEEATLPTLFVPMTGKAEAARERKPDGAHPAIVNGGFEEKSPGDGVQPGWYYERQVKWEEDEKSPEGKHFVTISNEEPDLPAHLLQGFAIDGREVTALEVSANVKYSSIVWGKAIEARPAIVVSLYDQNRKELGHFLIGPFHGTADWSNQSKLIAVPKATREGIFRVGLFGATGSISFDSVKIENKTLKK